MKVNNLQKAGIDYASGVERFGGMALLYEKYVVKFLSDETFHRLEVAMEKEDYNKAFEEAHTLKGETGNLSFVILYENICDLVEALRNQRDISLAKKTFIEVRDSYNILVKTIKEEF
ncbi:HPt (histidine-containing phosphotransfer) domain-containing protein [Hathewaya proteolytica DSM 3090]|uniref:HPt (Histidine-containing phosphotransfer) domain-containing protein n=1 Tax=Hathewaya proteolytica DSM 3090 TaxID=1121331 RepID=A0A1M6T959_9CLOT|nr:Hpt domain-containing protein [Hathewaya proteolytica]SHK53513.1 HPt (histidine-containing phosphotransfer) domain-containing protein [Hathewaya proteolytica DSM 3090]